jgi:hypothetical protein
VKTYRIKIEPCGDHFTSEVRDRQGGIVREVENSGATSDEALGYAVRNLWLGCCLDNSCLIELELPEY